MNGQRVVINVAMVIKPQYKHIIQLFNRLTGAHLLWEVWEDAIIMFACTISNTLDTRFRDKREQWYMDRIKKYRPEDAQIFVEIFAEIVMQLEENPEQDFLGDLYMTLELGSHWHGQFFTPYSLCEAMSAISMSLPQTKDDVAPITVNDPACGGGALLVAAFHTYRKRLQKLGLNPQSYMLCTAQDISVVAALMCYIQLSLQGIAAKIKIADSLSDPMIDADNGSNIWYTPMYFSNVWVTRRTLRRIDNA